MVNLIAASIDALIPLIGAVLLLARPQWFTKKDLKAEEHKALASRLKMIGWVLLGVGIFVLIANIGSMPSR